MVVAVVVVVVDVGAVVGVGVVGGVDVVLGSVAAVGWWSGWCVQIENKVKRKGKQTI